MNKFKLSVFGIIITGAIAACSQSDKTEVPNEIYFTENITVYPADAFVPDTIIGSILVDEVMGATSIKSGEGLIAVLTQRDDLMVKLYNSSGDSIGAFGRRGQGPDDLFNPFITRPYISATGDTCIWINDVAMGNMKLLNVSRSFKEGTTRVDSTVTTKFGGAINAFIVNNKLIFVFMNSDAYRLNYRNLSNPADTLHSEQMYIYPSTDYYAYQGKGDISPDGRYMAVGMYNFNQLNIIELPEMKRSAVSVGNVRKYTDSYNSETYTGKFIAYGDVTCGNNEIFAIYYGKENDNNKSEEENKGTTIHVIGYDGKVKKVLATKETLEEISFDHKNSILYGMDGDEHIYKYDIK